MAAATGTRGDGPGPVHLNVALHPPLVPGPDEDLTWPTGEPVRIAPCPPAFPEELPPARTVVLAGDAAPGTIPGPLPDVPVLAEPSSNLRRPGAIATYRLLLTTGLADRIERVVVVGHPTLSRPVVRLLSRSDVEIVVVSERLDWPDPGRAADRVLPAVPTVPADPAWTEQWQAADAHLSARLAALLAGRPGPTGPELAAAVVAATGPGEWLVLGASQPIRDADLAPIRPDPSYVLANRGLSGIDGTVATATGVGLAPGRPVTALIGDVTLAHDAGGLLVGPAERTPAMRLVVVNDGGGSIFHTLEQGDPRFDSGPYAGVFERVFATPHGIDLGALAMAYGWEHTRVTDRSGVAAALAVPVAGRTLIEVVVDRTGRRELDRAIRDLAGE